MKEIEKEEERGRKSARERARAKGGALVPFSYGEREQDMQIPKKGFFRWTKV